MYQVLNSNELYHYGILGQKWGVRRFQNPDGSLTDAGRTRYRTDKALNNIGRALTNTSAGQRFAVTLNKGYRTDKKEIKNNYKELKKEIKDSDDISAIKKERKAQLKYDKKMSKNEARVSAAQSIYSWQSEKQNTRIQTMKVGKKIVEGILLGSGSLTYDRLRAEDTNFASSAIWGALTNIGNKVTLGILSVGDYAVNKDSHKNAPIREK